MANPGRQEIRKRVFIVHLILFLLVMGGLSALNLNFTPTVLWFIYPLIGWGLGVVLHLLFALIWSRENWGETRKDWKSKGFLRSFIVHLVVYLAVNILLLVINLNFTPHILWVLYPAIGWGIGLVLHLVLTLLWGPRPE